MVIPETSLTTSTPRPLKIVMVDSHGAIERGGAVQCALLASGLARRGHKIACIFDRIPGETPDGSAVRDLRNDGVNIMQMPLANLIGMLRFRRFLKTESPDIIHTHKNRALFFVYLATLGMRRAPWAANRGTVYPLSRDTIAYYIHKRHVNCIMAVSHAVRNSLVDDGIPGKKVEVVYGSFDPRRFHRHVERTTMRRRWMISESTAVVGLVGSLNTPKKGHPVFLKAGKLLMQKRPDLKIVLVGEGNPQPLQALAASLGIADRVVFAGFIEDIPAALAAMDVVVCASLRGEGLTGAIREALAMGRPVVSTDVAGNGELVISEETGLLVPPGEPEALARAVEKILKNPELAVRYGEKGRQRVMELCAEDVRLARVENIYQTLLC
jgi:glycosyltransferase involved in cell wall biosynthesis